MKTTIIDDVESIVRRLNQPLNNDDLESGWTSESHESAKQYFQKLRSALIANQVLPPLGIVRGLDHRGVVSGDLLEEIARVTNLMRNEVAANNWQQDK